MNNSNVAPKRRFSLNFLNAWWHAFVNYVNFWGRTTVGDYWWFVGVIMLLVAALILTPFANLFINIDPVTFKPHVTQVTIPWQAFAYPLVACIIPYLTASIRRLRDSHTSMFSMIIPLMGLSGWLVFTLVNLAQSNKPVDGPGEGLATLGTVFAAGLYLLATQIVSGILLLIFFTGASEPDFVPTAGGLTTKADEDDQWLHHGINTHE